MKLLICGKEKNPSPPLPSGYLDVALLSLFESLTLWSLLDELILTLEG